MSCPNEIDGVFILPAMTPAEEAVLFGPGVYWGPPIKIGNPLTRSHRWKHRRMTNRRMRQCVYNSPRWHWLYRSHAVRWDDAKSGGRIPPR